MGNVGTQYYIWNTVFAERLNLVHASRERHRDILPAVRRIGWFPSHSEFIKDERLNIGVFILP
jgi:hypothetical protein